jgi:selenocysteine-specific elongation factor
MIVGTAGHIDHGKTSLVRALTGIDTDRLPEEQRRGITIELGFAPLDIPGLGIVGVVDVPGHEAFVRTMVAGATGVDVGLLVVAADEGVMPQTREHVAILRLLGVREIVVALTKCDLADEEWRQLVIDDVASALRAAGLAAAACVETSVRDGRGLVELRQALGAALAHSVPRNPRDLFRLPIDRAFSVKGTGTVVTGTAWSGTVRTGAELVLLPSGRTVRVRGLQAHGTSVDQAVAGSRVAAALAGVDVADAPRGSFLADLSVWTASDHLHAQVRREADAEPFRPREWLRLHVGTAEVGARIVGGNDAGGVVRVRTDEPVTLRAGDRFILRRSQPLSTVGGGVVLDPSPRTRRSRPSFGAAAGVRERVQALIEESGGTGLSLASLPVRLGPDLMGHDLSGDPAFLLSQGRLYLRRDLDATCQTVVEEVDTYHRINTLESGIPPAWLRAKFPGKESLVDLAVEELASSGRLELLGGTVRQPGWRPVMSKEHLALREWLLARLDAAGREPPALGELLSERTDAALEAVVRFLEKQGELVQVEPGRFYRPEVVEEMTGVVRAAMQQSKEPLSPAHLREALGISRKFLVPFLEYCDRRRITERRGEGRVLL